MEKLSDAKKRLSMSEKYDFLRKNYLESEMNDFVVVDHFSQIESPGLRTGSKWSKKHIYSFLTDIKNLDESLLDFSDVHDQKCCQYLSRKDAFPSYWMETENDGAEEYYYERIRGPRPRRFSSGQIYPLTYHREFNTNRFDTRGKYNVIEICEDFRHFHGLYPKGIDVEHVDKYFKEAEFGVTPFRWRVYGLCINPVLDAVFHKLSAHGRRWKNACDADYTTLQCRRR